MGGIHKTSGENHSVLSGGQIKGATAGAGHEMINPASKITFIKLVMTIDQKEKLRMYHYQQQMQYNAYMQQQQYLSIYGHLPPNSGYGGYHPGYGPMDMSM